MDVEIQWRIQIAIFPWGQSTRQFKACLNERHPQKRMLRTAQWKKELFWSPKMCSGCKLEIIWTFIYHVSGRLLKYTPV